MCSVKKGVLRNFEKFTGKHLRQSFFYNKETLAEVFSCEFCEISKNTFSTEHLRMAASGRHWDLEETKKLVNKWGEDNIQVRLKSSTKFV